MNTSFARVFMENRKKQGSLDSFFCSKAKQPKFKLNEEPDNLKEKGTPVEAEKPTQRRFQQSWKTKYGRVGNKEKQTDRWFFVRVQIIPPHLPIFWKSQ